MKLKKGRLMIPEPNDRVSWSRLGRSQMLQSHQFKTLLQGRRYLYLRLHLHLQLHRHLHLHLHPQLYPHLHL